MALFRLPPQRLFSPPFTIFSSPSLRYPRHLLLSPPPPPPLRLRFPCGPSLSTVSSSDAPIEERDSPPKPTKRWKPMCLYYTQGKCTMMDDTLHLEKFNHNYSMDLQVNTSNLSHLKAQDLDCVLVLDLEGKVEILEFPVVMIDTRTMEFVDSFHRVWHDTAIPFKDVLVEFESWMSNHHLWKTEHGGSLHRAAFVTCGNWDVKTKIPQQCEVSNMKLPPYFMEWINLKDIYLNFYSRRATGMMTMMRELEIPVMGSHHLGIDDSKNIARIVQRLLSDGAFLRITARRMSSDPGRKNIHRPRSNIYVGDGLNQQLT